ncbi:MAG: RidA family protein [Bryobacteraceae bacterium]|jgi:2-iminobutanoate/2-iminopropanoate deaminase
MIERISTPGAPAPRGPYSPAVRAGDYIFVSGQIPLDPITNQTRLGDVASETRQVLENIRLNLEGCGATLRDVVKTTVFLTNVQDFAAMNAAYAEVFGDSKPARSTVGVAALPLPGAKVEIEAIAYKPR